MIATVAGLELFLWWHLEGQYYWLIPLVFFVNVLISWALARMLVLPAIIFPYAQGYVKTQVHRDLNGRFCNELGKATDKLADVFDQFIAQEDHLKVPIQMYREVD